MDKKKELKQKYKMDIRPAGIFQIRDLTNNKIYIGKSTNLDGSLNGSKFQLKYGVHKNKNLQDAWNKFGEDKFSFEILDHLEPSENPDQNIKDELAVLEEMWLEKLQPNVEKEYK